MPWIYQKQWYVTCVVILVVCIVYISERKTGGVQQPTKVMPNTGQLDNKEDALSTRQQVLQSTYGNDTQEQSKWADLLQCQEMRLEHLRTQCSKQQFSSSMDSLNVEELKRLVTRFLVDDVHNMTLRSIPKTGCSSWKSMFIWNNLNDETLSLGGIEAHHWKVISSKYKMKVMHELTRKEILFYLRQNFSILTVRHPLARLESGFRDKILKKSQTIDVENERVVAFAFQRFLNEIIAEEDESSMNIHWRPVTTHTNPCTIPINFIAKTETASMDMEYILQEKLSSTRGAVHTHKYTQTALFTKPEREHDGGKELPLFNLLERPEHTIQRLMSKYKYDMKLFGYSYKSENGNIIALCDNYRKYNLCC